jgi:hypothetical protein
VTKKIELPSGISARWNKERWLSIEDGLLRLEREIRLLDRASPPAIVDVRDRALRNPRALLELENLRYEGLADSSHFRRVLSAVVSEVNQREPSLLRAFVLGRALELEYEIGLAECLGTAAIRSRVAEYYAALRGRLDAEALALTWLEVPHQTDVSRPRVSLKEAASQCVRAWPELRVVERRLLSRAAAGDGILFVRQGLEVTEAEAERIVTHEIQGHLRMRVRARSLGPPFRIGTAESWVDEEGRAVFLEAAQGLLSSERQFELALGHSVCQRLLGGEGPYDVFCALDSDAQSREALVTAICRGARGGGLCRELGYLVGYERVRRAFAHQPALVDRMGLGRLSVLAASELWLEADSRGTELSRPAKVEHSGRVV